MNSVTTLKEIAWSHNPEEGEIIGTLITQPEKVEFIMETKNELVAHAFIKDNSKRKWRVRTNAQLASQLLTYSTGQKIKLTGIKGSLCKNAWGNAKRQIVPSIIELKE